MIVNFQKYRNKKQEESARREELIAEIIRMHANRADGESADSFYFEHIREQFPTDMLEEILHKLQGKASNG